MILIVADGGIAITRNFIISFGDRSSDLMRMKVTSCLSVYESDDVFVSNISQRSFWIIFWGAPVRIEEPIVVGVLVMVASDLLLARTLRIGLNMRVKETTSITHVLDCRAGTIRNFKRAILSNLRAPQICLEKRAHLSVAWTAVLQNKEMNVEREHVDHKRDHNQTDHSSEEVLSVSDLEQVNMAR